MLFCKKYGNKIEEVSTNSIEKNENTNTTKQTITNENKEDGKLKYQSILNIIRGVE